MPTSCLGNFTATTNSALKPPGAHEANARSKATMKSPEQIERFLMANPVADPRLVQLFEHTRSEAYRDKVARCEEVERKSGLKWALIFGLSSVVCHIVLIPIVLHIQHWPVPSALTIAADLFLAGAMGAIFGNTWGRTKV